ncbi:hypothetical protein PIB30_049548 [Stylosanthes scabra]|uniref:Ubiquitin-like protease family profile domain-containing protein n=1 Tax=Stylosanthes scabra TaxID=79078 RepID=A0ABU6ZG35_9FABA|nr:hypothetical protein [Stylosanthes scabra]
METRKPKKRSAKGNEADETIHEVLRSTSEAVAGSFDRTRMFDSFDTVSLGRDNITKTQPSQPSNPGNEPEREDPLPEGPEPCSLTLREWLQPEAEGCAAKDLTNSPDATRMFDTYGLNYLDKKTKMPYLVKQLKDHEEYVQLLDMQKLKSHSVLFAPALYSNHWWLYVLDVQHKEFYIVDSVYGIAPNQNRNKLHRFACNVLNQLRVRAGAPSILKKGTIALQLRCVDVSKQPNPTDCGVYVMKWMELLDAATLSGCYQYKVRYDLEEWGQDRLDGFRAEIVAKLILSDENTLKVEAMTQAKKMGRQVRPSAALKSPYVQVSTAELDKNH